MIPHDGCTHTSTRNLVGGPAKGSSRCCPSRSEAPHRLHAPALASPREELRTEGPRSGRGTAGGEKAGLSPADPTCRRTATHVVPEERRVLTRQGDCSNQSRGRSEPPPTWVRRATPQRQRAWSCRPKRVPGNADRTFPGGARSIEGRGARPSPPGARPISRHGRGAVVLEAGDVRPPWRATAMRGAPGCRARGSTSRARRTKSEHDRDGPEPAKVGGLERDPA